MFGRSADVNDNTEGKPVHLEGLSATRLYVQGHQTLMGVVDEASGYYNHALSAPSQDMMAMAIYGYVFTFCAMVRNVERDGCSIQA